MNSKLRVRSFALLAVVAVLSPFIYNFHRHSESRQAIISLYAEMKPAIKINDIATLLHKREYRSLKLEKVSDSDLLVESPVELGAKNWLLSLKFKDGQLVFVHIQTSDNPLRPKEAPPDLDFAQSQTSGPHNPHPDAVQ